METQLLRTFIAVAGSGSISTAAVELGYAQSSVSEQLRRLERELGPSLLRRTSTGVTLTPAGQRLLSEASRLLVAEERLRRNTTSASRVRLGTVDTLATSWLPRALAALAPEQRPVVTMGRRDVLLEELVAGRCDVVVLYQPLDAPLPPVAGVERLVVASLGTDSVQIVVAPGDAPADGWLVTPRGCVHRELFDRRLAPFLDDLVIEAEGTTPDGLRRLARQGVGRAFLPSLAVADDIADGTLVTVDPPAGLHAEIAIVAVHAPDAGPDVRHVIRRVTERGGPNASP